MLTSVKESTASPQVTDTLPLIIFMTGTDTTQPFIYHRSHHIHPWLKKTGTCLLKASNILLYYFVSIKSLLSTTLLRIENDSDRKFSKSIFFQIFSGNHFMVPCSLLAENIISVFLSPHLPLDTLILDTLISPLLIKKSPATAGLIKKSICSWTFLLVYNCLKLKLKRPSKNNTITVYQSLKTSAHRNPRKCRILQDIAL